MGFKKKQTISDRFKIGINFNKRKWLVETKVIPKS